MISKFLRLPFFFFVCLFFFAWVLIFAPGASPAQSKSIPKTVLGEASSLIGRVQLNSSVGAKTYKAKIKQSGQTRYEVSVPAGKPFRIDAMAPGLYDLVVEANGHSTLVKSGLIKIDARKTTRFRIEMVKAPVIFLEGDATEIILCSACHKKIYMEMMRGEGSDFLTGPWPGPGGGLIHLPDTRDFYKDASPEHLAYVSPITVATIAKQPEEKRDACRRCHAPTLIHQGGETPTPPSLRQKNRRDGVSCASCHLDKDGNVHGKYDLSAPHPTVQDPLFTRARSAEICAACHQNDPAAPAQQTVSEWQSDFAPRDRRTCEDCHMPQDVRLLSEIFSDRPVRVIGRHLFAGGHSLSMLKKAATLSVEQDHLDPGTIHIEITNDGAGHSLPTGYAPRAVLLHVKITGPDGSVHLDSARESPLAIYAVNPGLSPGDEQIRPAIRAGAREKVTLQIGNKPGTYRIEAALFYDLDRLLGYNDKNLPLIASASARFTLAAND